MAYERKDSTGTLWVNTKKDTPKHPDMTGDCLIGGTQYRIAGWYATSEDGEKRLDRNGKPFLNCKFSLPDPKYAKKPTTEAADTIDADLPF